MAAKKKAHKTSYELRVRELEEALQGAHEGISAITKKLATEEAKVNVLIGEKITAEEALTEREVEIEDLKRQVERYHSVFERAEPPVEAMPPRSNLRRSWMAFKAALKGK